MTRTTIMLPQDLKARAIHLASEMGISLGQLIRESLENMLDVSRAVEHEDPLFSDTAVFEGPCPLDLSKDHDRYLYGDNS